MKKLLMLLLAFLIVNAAFIAEGGQLRVFIAPTVIIPLILGPLLTTLFSFNLSELRCAFREAFSGDVDTGRLADYRINLLIIKNLESGVMFWSLTIVASGIILILSHLSAPETLGPSIAVTLLALMHGFSLRAMLLNPMEHSLLKKILLAEQDGTQNV